jgi:hypothetical protein
MSQEYELVAGPLPFSGEDPFIWEDNRGFHIVYHAKLRDDGIEVGGYAYSKGTIRRPYHVPFFLVNCCSMPSVVIIFVSVQYLLDNI